MENIKYKVSNEIRIISELNFFAIMQIYYNSIYLFEKDMESFFSDLKEFRDSLSLYYYLEKKGIMNSYEEIYDTIELLCKLGILVSSDNKIIIDKKMIEEFNEIESYCDILSDYGKPTILQIEITNECNLRCKHCYIDEFKNNLTLKDLVKIADDVKNTNIIKVVFTGGEIALNKEWKEIFEYFINKKMIVSAITNLTRFNYQDLDFFVKNNIHIKTSLYSLNNKKHDYITGTIGSWEKTMGNIKYLKRKGSSPEINVVVMKDNVDEIIEMKNFFRNNGYKANFDFRIIPSRKNKKDIENLLISKNDFSRLSNENIFYRQDETTCSAFTYRLMINPNGDLFGCDLLSNSVGNIKMQSISNIIKSDRFSNSRDCILGYNSMECNKCKYCNKCIICPALKENKNKYNNKNINCLFTEYYHGDKNV